MKFELCSTRCITLDSIILYAVFSRLGICWLVLYLRSLCVYIYRTCSGIEIGNKTENTRFLLPPQNSSGVKKPFYWFKCADEIIHKYNSKKQSHKTMGMHHVHLNPPSKFLRWMVRITRPYRSKNFHFFWTVFSLFSIIAYG